MDFRKICYNCMKEKPIADGYCPYCGFNNAEYRYPPNQLSPGTPLNGKYILGRALGTGGFGITYLALDVHLQMVVAIKELFLKNISIRNANNTISVSAGNRKTFEINKQRFLKEARILAVFNEQDNEGVVVVRDHFEENNTAYIVMEYLHGMTLKNLVSKSKLSFEETRRLMDPICRSLMKIHQLGVVHLDVSPDNIMILNDNRAKLLDFGGARIIGVDPGDFVTFKRGYAPPEQYSENGNIGPWTDVFATAATMYYCMTKVKPPDSIDRESGIAKLVKPSRYGVKIPRKIQNVLLKALELNPGMRYQTMDEFWEAMYAPSRRKETRISELDHAFTVVLVLAVIAAAVVVLLSLSGLDILVLDFFSDLF